MSITLAFVLALALADPVGLIAGEPAPFDGVLVDADRAGELVLAEAEARTLAKQLADQRALTAAWKAAASRDWTENPELRFWGGVVVGGVVGGVAIVLGGWVAGLTAAPPG